MGGNDCKIGRNGLKTSRVFAALAAAIAAISAAPSEAAVVPPAPVAAPERSSPGSRVELFQDPGIEPRRGTVGGGDLVLESPALSDPLHFLPGVSRRMRPQDAEMKVGELYLDLLSASASVLHTDNVNLTPTGREGKTISIFRIGAAAIYQFNERLQFGVAGRFVYLPNQGEFGLAGFGIEDPLYSFTRHPIFLADLRFESQLDEWDVELFNRFAVRAAPSTNNALGFEFNEEDRANRHVFRDPFTPRGAGEAFLVRSNTTGGAARRLLPTETRLTIGANRTYWWYDEGPQNRLLFDQRDRGFLWLASERENMRFKPFTSYQADRFNSNRWAHQARAGLEGPMSEYLIARVEAGYFWADDVDRDGRLWMIRLKHTPTPLTYHQLSFSQSLREPLRDLDQTWAYLIRHELNSTVSLGASVEKTTFEILDIPGTKGDEWGAYAGFSAVVIADGGIGFQGGYEHRRFDDQPLGFQKSWILRTRVRHRSIQGDLHYRYIDRESQTANIDYTEHVIMFTLTKYF